MRPSLSLGCLYKPVVDDLLKLFNACGFLCEGFANIEQWLASSTTQKFHRARLDTYIHPRKYVKTKQQQQQQQNLSIEKESKSCCISQTLILSHRGNHGENRGKKWNP